MVTFSFPLFCSYKEMKLNMHFKFFLLLYAQLLRLFFDKIGLDTFVAYLCINQVKS